MYGPQPRHGSTQPAVLLGDSRGALWGIYRKGSPTLACSSWHLRTFLSWGLHKPDGFDSLRWTLESCLIVYWTHLYFGLRNIQRQQIPRLTWLRVHKRALLVVLTLLSDNVPGYHLIHLWWKTAKNHSLFTILHAICDFIDLSPVPLLTCLPSKRILVCLIFPRMKLSNIFPFHERFTYALYGLGDHE